MKITVAGNIRSGKNTFAKAEKQTENPSLSQSITLNAVLRLCRTLFPLKFLIKSGVRISRIYNGKNENPVISRVTRIVSIESNLLG